MLNAHIGAIYLQKYRKIFRNGFVLLGFVGASVLDLT